MHEVVEQGELHPRADMVDERDVAVGESEHHRVLVLHVGWPEQLAGRLFNLEPLAVPVQAVGADPPRSVSGRGHLRVGHHQSPFATVLHPPHPRVLETQRAPDHLPRQWAGRATDGPDAL
jgi:hypothetical protein